MERTVEEEALIAGASLAPERSWGRWRSYGTLGVTFFAAALVVYCRNSPRAIALNDSNAFMQAQYDSGDAQPAAPAVDPAVAVPVDQAAPAAPSESSDCSWEGENCASTIGKCCKRVGLTCWEKEPDSWGGCSETCEELKQFGGEWTCTALSSPTEPKILQPAPEAPAGITLFCFMVITPQGVCPPGVDEGYEQLLVDAMREAQASVFACEDSEVFEGARTTEGEWKSIKNTEVFTNVWRDVQANGKYLQHPFTVKADADAVFIPLRLTMHLEGLKPPPGEAMYAKNIDFKYRFMGALEVLSKEAVDLLLQNIDQCVEHIGTEGGEDVFTMECLDAVGAGSMEDDSILDDKYSDPANFNLFDIDRCKSDAIVAFHPYKAVNSWMGCLKVANGEVEPSQFTSCEHRWEGEACSLSGTLDHPGQVDPGTGIVG